MADFRAQNVDASTGLKVCPLCAETIKAAAKVCPFCRASQTRVGQWVPLLPVGASVLVMLAVLGMVGVWAFPHWEERNFDPYRAQLVVARTSLERDSAKAETWLSGYITNTGKYPWRVLELEVRVLDGEGKLVDVPRPHPFGSFVVQPHQDAAFRVSLNRLVFTNLDAVTQVRVRTASDGNRPPKDD